MMKNTITNPTPNLEKNLIIIWITPPKTKNPPKATIIIKKREVNLIIMVVEIEEIIPLDKEMEEMVILIRDRKVD